MREWGRVSSHLFHCLRVDDRMPDPFPLPGVGDVNQTIARLNDGGVGILARLVFEGQHLSPGLAIV